MDPGKELVIVIIIAIVLSIVCFYPIRNMVMQPYDNFCKSIGKDKAIDYYYERGQMAKTKNKKQVVKSKEWIGALKKVEGLAKLINKSSDKMSDDILSDFVFSLNKRYQGRILQIVGSGLEYDYEEKENETK